MKRRPILPIRAVLLAAALGLPAVSGAASAAGPCELKQIAVLDTTLTAWGSILVPVTIDGRSSRLVLDTGAVWSVLRPSVAAGLPVHTAARALTGAGGAVLNRVATVPTLQLGTIPIKQVDFFLTAEGFSGDPAVGGNLALNLLGWADVEIDPALNRVTLFSQDHCPGKVVHWPHSDLTEIPLQIGEDRLATIPVELDGRSLTALLDTGSVLTMLDSGAADRLFGVDADSPGSETFADTTTIEGTHVKTFRRRFGALALGGITFQSPPIMIAANRGLAAGQGGGRAAPLMLGMHELRRLHLYIAYGEKMLYATTLAGDAAAAPGAGRPAAAAPDMLDLQDAGRDVLQAEAAIRTRNYQAALDKLDGAIRLAPDRAGYYGLRGEVRALLGQEQPALDDAAAAVRLDPGTAGGFAARCLVHLRRNEVAAALADGEQAGTLAPADPVALGARGLARFRSGRWTGAIADFDGALKLAAQPVWLYARGLAKDRAGDQAGGAQDQAAARRLDPTVEMDLARLP